MSRKDTLKSNIMEAVHETASDFHRFGFIDKPKMREFDVLCLAPSKANRLVLRHNFKEMSV